MICGTIFSIEEFSVYDGPGIRTSVFFKGCPLRCTWCHNPEGQEISPCIVRSPNGCIGCGACMASAERKNEKIIFTEECIKKCPMNLLRKCGEELTADELFEKVIKNEIFLKKGGVTFSGGEPTAQGEFLIECLKKFRGRLHTAVQTSGFCKEEIFLKTLENADYFLYDIKIVDKALHKKYTGVENDCILNNFGTLAKSGKDFVARIPLIPAVTDTKENITAVARLLKENNVAYAELLPYNKAAGGKYKMLMRKYEPGFDETVPPKVRTDIFEAFGIKTKVL